MRAFERESGIELRIVPAGDAGQLVNRAILTAGNPEGDVLFGIDDNLLPKAVEAGVFEPYESPELSRVDDAYELDPTHAVTPVDRGDVCLNVDLDWFAERGPRRRRPTSPTSRDARVPGAHGRREPRDVDARARVPARDDRPVRRATAGRTTGATCGRTTCSSSTGGSRPTSASSPAPAAGRASVRSWCRTRRARSPRWSSPRNRSTRRRRPRSPRAATARWSSRGCSPAPSTPTRPAQVIDFLLSRPFQEDVPLRMFVFPVADDAELPEEFVRWAEEPATPLRLAARAGRGRARRLGPDVDRPDVRLSRGDGASGASRSLRCRPSFLGLFFVYPLGVDRGVGDRRRVAGNSCSAMHGCAA